MISVSLYLTLRMAASFARLAILLFWLVPSIFLCVFFQWSYKKKYSNVFVAKVLNNLKDLDVRFSKRNHKTLIQQYLPGLPSGGIKSSDTLFLLSNIQFLCLVLV